MMILLVVVLALSPASERPPINNPESVAARASLFSCVERAAVRLERSREAASVVAEASVVACATQREAFQEAAAGDDWRFAAVLMPQIDERLRQLAQARVVEIRSNRSR